MNRTNFVRRGIGLLVGCAPVILLLASTIYAVSHENRHAVVGSAVTLIALFIGVLNFYLSFVRGRLFRRAKESLDGYKHVSGFPGIGTLLLMIGTVLGFGSAVCAALGMLTVGLDTGGSVWFLIATWRDSSLWDQ